MSAMHMYVANDARASQTDNSFLAARKMLVFIITQCKNKRFQACVAPRKASLSKSAKIKSTNNTTVLKRPSQYNALKIHGMCVGWQNECEWAPFKKS